MAVAARVTEVAVTDDGALYVSLSVWATRLRRARGLDPDISNDFVFDIEREQTRLVTNELGQYRHDGEWFDPDTEPPEGGWDTESYLLTREEVRAFVREHMRAWVRRHVAEKRGSGDFRSKLIQRYRDRDPRGLLAEADGLAGEEFDE